MNRLTKRRAPLAQNSTFKLSPIALALLLTASGQAMAFEAPSAMQQDNAQTASDEEKKKEAEDETEVIVVSGIRNSLKEAQSIKKLSDNVVDALVAEDIGKFPDENVAEALQRIPGISVTRKNGEGQTVTIRGLTGNYNITTFNGRKLASDNSSRDFNYDVIASELVNEIRVHKTPSAHLQEGAIGGVVEIFSRRPLDVGPALSASVEADYNERAEAWNPKYSLIASEMITDDFGVLFSVVHTETTSRYDSYWSSWWSDNSYADFGNNVQIPAGASADDVMRAPSFPKINMNRADRQRTGGTLALQWLPTPEIDVNFDALYTTYDIESSGRVLSLATPRSWGPFGEYTEFSVGADGFVDSMAWNDATLELLEDSEPRESETYQVGLNVNWIIDDVTLNFDAAYSAAENVNKGDTNFVVVRAAVDAASINFNNGQTIPDIWLSSPLDETADYGAHYSRRDGVNVEDETGRLVVDGVWELNDGIISEVLFGAGYNMQEKDRVHYTPINGSIFALDFMDEINPTYDAETVMIGGQEMWKLPAHIILPGSSDNFGGNANVPASWASIDVDALYEFYKELDPDAYAKVIPSLNESGGNTYAVKEETWHAYGEIKLRDELFDMPYMLDAGIRYVRTEVTSHGYSQDPANIEFDADGKPANENWRERHLVNFKGDYSEWLPSINFRLELTDELVLRLAASKAMARPGLSNLRPITSITPYAESSQDGRIERTMFENDPGLSPYTAKQFDTALEWYYSESGNLALATFYKDVEAFVKDEVTTEVIAGQDFQVTRPYNDTENASVIRGYEIAWYQTFDEFLPEAFAGFGIALNHTYNNSESGEYDVEGKEIPFWGLSEHQSNAHLFYENHGFSASVAYNRRSDFAARKAWHWTYETFGWVDNEQATSNAWESLSVSFAYDVTENLRITADGNNLLDPEDVLTVDAANTELLAAGASSAQYYLSSASYGRRYSIGLRYQF